MVPVPIKNKYMRRAIILVVGVERLLRFNKKGLRSQVLESNCLIFVWKLRRNIAP